MREPGWYWVKVKSWKEWVCADLDADGTWFFPDYCNWENEPILIGPKIEEPKDE